MSFLFRIAWRLFDWRASGSQECQIEMNEFVPYRTILNHHLQGSNLVSEEPPDS